MTQHPTDETRVEDLIRSAVDAIGADNRNDYDIRPAAFPEVLKDLAPALAKILSHSSLTETARRYEQQNAKAIAIQALLKHLSARATWSICVATLTGALLASLTAIAKEASEAWFQPLTILLGLCASIAGALAAMTLYRIAEGRLLQTWMTARAKAESQRVEYFDRVVKRVVDPGRNDPGLQLLSLELFRRYQLGLQQTYFRNRGAKHEASRKTTLTIGALAAAVLSFGSGGFGIWGAFQPEVLSLAALGTIGAALAVVASRREELNQDARNAERYEKTSEALSRIRERHSDVQLSVAEGDSMVLVQYVDAVHEQLTLEHRQWLAATEEIDTTLKELYASLERHAEEESRGDEIAHGAGAAPTG